MLLARLEFANDGRTAELDVTSDLEGICALPKSP